MDPGGLARIHFGKGSWSGSESCESLRPEGEGVIGRVAVDPSPGRAGGVLEIGALGSEFAEPAPEWPVLRGPALELLVGVPAGVDVDERRRLHVGGDR